MVARYILRLLLLLLILFSAGPLFAAELNIVINGLEGAALENVQKVLAPPLSWQQAELVPSFWLRRLAEKAPPRVKKALEPFGFYQSQVKIRLNELARPPLLQVDIIPGTAVRVLKLELKLEGDPALNSFLPPFPLRPGDILRHDVYEKGKSGLLAAAVERGYLDAAFSRHIVMVDAAAASAEIELTLASGPRYRIGEIRFSGAPEYPESFLRRYLSFKPGSFFSFAEIGRSRLNLIDSDRFRQVSIAECKEDATDDRIPVRIALDPAPSRRLRTGLGYGTDTGARLSLKAQDLNVRNLGHELDINLLLAQLRQDLNLSYQIPSSRNLKSFSALRAGYRAEDLDSYETSYFFSEAERIYGLKQNRLISLFGRWQAEDSDLGDENLKSELLICGLRYRQAKIDNPVRPGRGWRCFLESRGIVNLSQPDSPAMQLQGDFQLIRPLPWKSLLLLRGAGGLTVPADSLAELPASLRFYAGGDSSVRGYAYQSLGPRDENGEVVGGRHLLIGSLEIESTITADWSGAVFFDIGNAFDNFSDLNLKKATGIGLRYYTPVGPLRLDLARTIGDSKADFRLHFGLGVSW